jgi:hypothetical protein
LGVFAVGAFKQYSAGSAIYPHAAQPAAIVVGKGAYEFTTFTPPAEGHFLNGTGNLNGTGTTQGPCVGCHMNSGKTHSLEITVDTFAKNCSKCHDADFSQADVDAAKAEFEIEVDTIGAMLVDKVITLDSINTLPERKGFDMSLGAKDNAIAQKNMGAWFNWYPLKTSDPAAYVHNPSYTNKIIQDTKDYLNGL